MYFFWSLRRPFTIEEYKEMIEQNEIDPNTSIEELNKFSKKSLSDWLTNRYQLVIRNEENVSENTLLILHMRR